eukprot:747673-Hanusia_phi.AAC.9
MCNLLQQGHLRPLGKHTLLSCFCFLLLHYSSLSSCPPPHPHPSCSTPPLAPLVLPSSSCSDPYFSHLLLPRLLPAPNAPSLPLPISPKPGLVFFFYVLLARAIGGQEARAGRREGGRGEDEGGRKGRETSYSILQTSRGISGLALSGSVLLVRHLWQLQQQPSNIARQPFAMQRLLSLLVPDLLLLCLPPLCRPCAEQECRNLEAFESPPPPHLLVT